MHITQLKAAWSAISIAYLLLGGEELVSFQMIDFIAMEQSVGLILRQGTLDTHAKVSAVERYPVTRK